MAEAALMEKPEANPRAQLEARKRIFAEAQDRQGADQAHIANMGLKDRKAPNQINATRFKLAEFDRQEWIVNAELSHTVDDLLRPDYWAHVAQQLSPYDTIEVRAEDGTWMAELLVVETDRAWVKVVLKAKYEFKSTDELPEVERLHRVEFKGPQNRFTVIRLSDGQMIRTGFAKKEEAEAWMREHEKTVTT